MIDRIQWLGHGSFAIQGTPLIYINPWRVTRSAFLADLILIGHDHYEHFSPADIEKLRDTQTVVVANEKVASQLESVKVLRPWQSITVERARVTAIPAYSPDGVHHPLEEGGLGFVISLDFYDIYYAGDTMKTPDMMRVHPDIAILPIDGHGTLTVEEAAEVVREMRPRYAIPCNWGTIVTGATLQDAQRFKSAVGDRAEVIIPGEDNDHA
jgi:L-ascorbate metabolism protein UlaG (beta-lactamase superfamily)